MVRIPLPPQSRLIKKVLPRSFLGRSLLIILIPLVITLAVAVQVFNGNHLNLVSRRFTGAVAGEIAATIDLLTRFPTAADRIWAVRAADENFGFLIRLEPGRRLDSSAPWEERRYGLFDTVDDDFAAAMRERVGRPFVLDFEADPTIVRVLVGLDDGVLVIDVPRKRLYTGTLTLFVLWLVGTAVLLFAIAALFMRNQVRAIRRLAAAAEAFGMGRDQGPIRPEGAVEVRQAATAFNRMQERIRRFLQQRTEMLAGVSHDLRTPLTRLRLSLAMIPPNAALAADVAGMTEDVAEMDRMIAGYLAFARGEGMEQARETDLVAMLGEVASAAARGGAVVELDTSPTLVLKLRADALRRALSNLVDNARRHAHRIVLSAGPSGARLVQVTIDDDGPGIPKERRESVFKPYATGAEGGTGLGLTIARDIVRAHGGDILLEDSPLGGLRARLVLPV
jgi:two-component system osmolarity sensor histidine kinase EnvZ